MDLSADLSTHKRSMSAPSTSLESLAEAALHHYQTTPCSVLELHSLEDEASRSLRKTLLEAQQELSAAVQSGVLDAAAAGKQEREQEGGSSGRRHYSSDSPHEGGSDGDDGGSRGHSGGGRAQHQRGESLDELELELAGLSAREREAAIKRAKNRQAARRSRERKIERITSLQQEVEALRSNNFVLLKCIEEVASKALAARAEHAQLKEQLAKATAASHLQPATQAAAVPAVAAAAAAAVAAEAPTMQGPGTSACTPPAAKRAAALEKELRLLEAGQRSPTQPLLMPQWPEQQPEAGPQAVPAAPLLPGPAPATDLTGQQLQGGIAPASRPATASSAQGAPITAGPFAPAHHLCPSPLAGSRGLLAQRRLLEAQKQGQELQGQELQGQELQGQELQGQEMQGQEQQEEEQQQKAGEGLQRICSAPGPLMPAGGAPEGAPAELPVWLADLAS